MPLRQVCCNSNTSPKNRITCDKASKTRQVPGCQKFKPQKCLVFISSGKLGGSLLLSDHIQLLVFVCDCTSKKEPCKKVFSDSLYMLAQPFKKNNANDVLARYFLQILERYRLHVLVPFKRSAGLIRIQSIRKFEVPNIDNVICAFFDP